MSKPALLEMPAVVYSRQRAHYPGVFSHIQGLFKDPAPVDPDPMAHPIDTILDALRSMGSLKFERKVRLAKSARDPTFGEYPFILVGCHFVTRDLVLPFLKEIYMMGHVEDKQESEYVEHLEEDLEAKGFFGRIAQSTRDLFGLKKKEDKKRFFANVLGIASETEAHTMLTTALDTLAEKYAHKKYLFALLGQQKTQLISLTDLVVYAYLKEALVYAPNSPTIAQMAAGAEKYRPLHAFLETCEADLKAGNLTFTQSPLTAEEIFAAGERCVHRAMVEYPLGPRTLPKVPPSKIGWGERALQLGILAGVLVGITMINMGSAPDVPEPPSQTSAPPSVSPPMMETPPVQAKVVAQVPASGAVSAAIPVAAKVVATAPVPVPVSASAPATAPVPAPAPTPTAAKVQTPAPVPVSAPAPPKASK